MGVLRPVGKNTSNKALTLIVTRIPEVENIGDVGSIVGEL